VVFATSVAVGAVLTPKEDLVEALFGKFQDLTLPAFVAGAACVLAIIAFVFLFKDRLILSLFSPELASATGVKIDRLNLYFLLAFSMTVLVGLRFLGGLLVGSLIILPASTGRRLGNNISQFLFFSSAASLTAVGAGFVIGKYIFHVSMSGPVIVITSAVIFALSLLKPGR
jgi:ABC-type Mn2+/Zn2+ transport system permease subunit